MGGRELEREGEDKDCLNSCDFYLKSEKESLLLRLELS